MHAPATYILVHPRLERSQGSSNERRRSERFVAHIDVELKSHAHEHHTTIDVSRDGLLVAASPLPPLKQPLMLALSLPDGLLSVMAVVARHTVVGGEPAMGLKLLGLSRDRERRWMRAIARLAEARRSEELVERSFAGRAARGAGEYALLGELEFDIDVILGDG